MDADEPCRCGIAHSPPFRCCLQLAHQGDDREKTDATARKPTHAFSRSTAAAPGLHCLTLHLVFRAGPLLSCVLRLVVRCVALQFAAAISCTTGLLLVLQHCRCQCTVKAIPQLDQTINAASGEKSLPELGLQRVFRFWLAAEFSTFTDFLFAHQSSMSYKHRSALTCTASIISGSQQPRTASWLLGPV